MTVDDVDLVAQPTANLLGIIRPSVADSRLTLQHFNTLGAFTTFVVPHNSDASNDWPPPFIFDIAYGCAALRAWGVATFVQFSRMHARGVYYDLKDEKRMKVGVVVVETWIWVVVEMQEMRGVVIRTGVMTSQIMFPGLGGVPTCCMVAMLQSRMERARHREMVKKTFLILT